MVAALMAAAALFGVLALPAAAMPGPSSMTLGFVDDPAFQDPSSASAAHWLSIARGMGSTNVRLGIIWADIAPPTRPVRFNAGDPRDPAYRFGALDAAVRNAAAHGQAIALVVIHAPLWAEGPGMPSTAFPGSWEPSASALGAFAHALAVRYSGSFPDPQGHRRKLPRVTRFQAWNEPNMDRYVSPQWYRDTSTGAIVPASPGIYRSMLNAFYAGVKSVQPRATVLSAGTAPYGGAPGATVMKPVVFLRSLFCLSDRLKPLGCTNPPHFDVLDHHPYALTPTSHAHDPDNISIPDFDKIFRILHAAQHYGLALPHGPKQVWCTELDWSSGPPADTPALQARYLPLGFYELWRQGISHVYWFQLEDPIKDNSFVTGGLFNRTGVAKPAAAAYRFPFASIHVPGHAKQVIVWGRAPTSGTVVIQKLVRGRWKRVLSLRTTSGGIFYTQRKLGLQSVLRAVIAGLASPSYTTA